MNKLRTWFTSLNGLKQAIVAGMFFLGLGFTIGIQVDGWVGVPQKLDDHILNQVEQHAQIDRRFNEMEQSGIQLNAKLDRVICLLQEENPLSCER